MKVSLNWARELSGVTTKTPQLLDLIGTRLGAIDEVQDIGAAYEGVTIVKIMECEKHPNADKLSICKVDDRGSVKNVRRDSKGLVQVVCGAPNARAGIYAAWIPPGATVPSTFSKDPFTLEAKELRGMMSYGMLASPKELGFGDSHAGLLELDGDAKPGGNFAKTYELDDVIIDIENKMFTHRPDLFGQLGVAREIAGITHKKFTSPGWYSLGAKIAAGRPAIKLAIKNEIPESVPRFCAVAVSGVSIGQSPVWLQACLSKLGVKPVNNIVDITNYIMLLTAQPLHAYDYDKIKSGTLGVRLSRAGEELNLLGGKKLKLKSGAVVITDGKNPIGLGGIMGGKDTEVDASTKNIILEAATFDMGLTRRTAFEYGLFTDAATRFTKNQSPQQNTVVLARSLELVQQLAGGITATLQDDMRGVNLKPSAVKVSTKFVDSRLGLNLQTTDIKRLLGNVELTLAESGDNLRVTPPFWRTDIHIPEDIVEEVGRLYGYEHLPNILPVKDISPHGPDPLLDFKSRLRGILSAAGCNEVLTYSFISKELMEKVSQDSRQAYALANPQSPEFAYYRLSVLPSLLDKVHPNIKQGYDQFALFEIGKGHDKMHLKDGQEKVPKEFNSLALVFAASAKSQKEPGAAYYSARMYLDYLAQRLGLTLNYQPAGGEKTFPAAKPFALNRTALVAHYPSNTPLGIIGEFKPQVAKALKLPKFAAGFEIDIESLQKIAKDFPQYEPLNKFPSLEQDICLRMAAAIPYEDAQSVLEDVLSSAAKSSGYKWRVVPLDIFQKDSNSSQKQTSWRIWLWHPARTLVTAETNKLLDKIAAKAKQKLRATRV